jgi:exonuclease III
LIAANTDTDGRIISIVLQHKDYDINVINIYAPTEDHKRDTFFETAKKLAISTQYTIIAGDFNCIDDIPMDKNGGNVTRGTKGATK